MKIMSYGTNRSDQLVSNEKLRLISLNSRYGVFDRTVVSTVIVFVTSKRFDTRDSRKKLSQALYNNNYTVNLLSHELV